MTSLQWFLRQRLIELDYLITVGILCITWNYSYKRSTSHWEIMKAWKMPFHMVGTLVASSSFPMPLHKNEKACFNSNNYSDLIFQTKASFALDSIICDASVFRWSKSMQSFITYQMPGRLESTIIKHVPPLSNDTQVWSVLVQPRPHLV